MQVNQHQQLEPGSSSYNKLSDDGEESSEEVPKLDLINQQLSKTIENSEILDEPNILEMPDDTSDNGIGLSDIPIMKISSDEKTTGKLKKQNK